MKNHLYVSCVISLSLYAEWRDWLPYFSNTPVKPQTFEQILQDPALDKKCYNERLVAAHQGEYPRASTCKLFKNMQTHINKAKEIETYLNEQRTLASKKKSLEEQLQIHEEEKVKKIAAFTAIGAGSFSISGLILKSLISPRAIRYTGLIPWFGSGAILGLTTGIWRAAQKEQKLKDDLLKMKEK